MKFGEIILVLFVFFTGFSCLEISAQDSKPSKRIKLLNNYGAIPFEDGKTIVADVTFTGLNAFPENDVLSHLRWKQAAIKAENEFYGYKVAKAVKAIRELLYERGYINAEVAAFGERLPENEMKIDFVINQGELARVSEIRFQGNKIFTNRELVEELKRCSEDDFENYEPRRFDYYSRTCMRGFMLGRGYLKFKLQEPKLIRVDGGYIIEIDLEEGNRYRTGEIKIAGAKVFTPKEIREMLEFKEGEILNGRELQNSIFEKLQKIYVDKGYVLYNADFDLFYIEPQVKTLDGTVDLEISIDEGKLFKLAKIEFTGVENDEAKRLRNLIPLADGEVFSQSKIEEGIKKINETKGFYPIEYQSTAIEVRTSIEPETERVEGSLLVRRKDEAEVKNEGDVFLVIKLKKIVQ